MSVKNAETSDAERCISNAFRALSGAESET